MSRGPGRNGRNDTANNKVYVHLFDDTAPPTDGSNLFLMGGGWGTLTIDGDYLWLENLTIEHATPEGLRVNTSANSTVLKRITALAAIVNLRGTNTLAEDLDVSHVIAQRTDPSQCATRTPASESASAGTERVRTSPGHRHRGELSLAWTDRPPRVRAPIVEWQRCARPEHVGALHVLGLPEPHRVGRWDRRRDPAQRLRNGQDSIYFERNDFDHLTVEHNVFVNGALFWVSDNGVGGTRPTSWRFRYNITPTVAYDDKTYPTVAADCNTFIPASTENTFLMKITGTDGRAGTSYDTLAQIQADTALEDRSVALPIRNGPTARSSGVSWAESSDDFDFQPANGVTTLNMCGAEPVRTC